PSLPKKEKAPRSHPGGQRRRSVCLPSITEERSLAFAPLTPAVSPPRKRVERELLAAAISSFRGDSRVIRLRLRPGREASVLRRHPWLFSGAVGSTEGDGSDGLAEVVDAS